MLSLLALLHEPVSTTAQLWLKKKKIKNELQEFLITDSGYCPVQRLDLPFLPTAAEDANYMLWNTSDFSL